MSEIDAILELLALVLLDARTVALFALLFMAAVIDVKSYRVPNWLTGSGSVIGLLFTVGTPVMLPHGVLWALLGMLTGLGIMLPLWILRVMGAGDAKLMAMVGVYLGSAHTLGAALAAFILAGIMALAFALMKGALGQLLGNVRNGVGAMLWTAMAGMRPQHGLDEKTSLGRLPFAVSIAAGTVGYVLSKHFGLIN